MEKIFLNSFITSLAVVFGVVSTKIFPWRLIQQHFPILKETFQYPRRISVLFIPLILIALGITANEIVKKDNREISVGVIVLLSLVFLSSYNRTIRLNSFYTVNTFMLNTEENHRQIAAVRSKNPGELFVKKIITEPDYLPKYKNISSRKAIRVYSKTLKDSNSRFKHKVLSKGRLEISWKGKSLKEITLPLVIYKRSQLILNGKQVGNAHKNAVGMPRVKQLVGKNVAILSFKTSFLFKMLVTIAILSWIIISVSGISFTIKERRNGKSEVL